MSSRASRPRRRMATVAGATALSLGSFSIAGLGGFRPASVYGSQLSPRSFALTCTHYVEDDTELQNAVMSSVDLDVICIENSITLSRTLELDDTSVTFLGDDTNTTLTAPAGDRHIKADFADAQADTLLIQQLTLSGGQGPLGDAGGSVYVKDNPGIADADTIFLRDTYFTANYSGRSGGAVYSTVPTYVYGGVFADDSAADSGGAIFMDAPLTLDGASFRGTRAVGQSGGAIFMAYLGIPRPLTVIRANFHDTRADDNGGAIHSSGGEIDITDSVFQGTSADDTGGGAVRGRDDITITNSTFTQTSAGGANGGAIWSTSESVYVTGGEFINTNAQASGGAIAADDTVSIDGTRFQSTHADSGGAVFAGGSINVARAAFIDSEARAGDGGAIRNGFGPGITIIRDSYFLANSATNDGGAISASSDVWVDTSTFSTNEAGRNGGAIDVGLFDVTVVNSTFFENTAGTAGSGRGGAISASGAVSSTFTTFTDDSGNNPSSVIYASSATSLTLIGSVVSPRAGAPVGACNIGATNASLDSFSTDSSCGVGDDTVNVVTRAQLGFDDTLVTDDSTGARVLIPDDTSILVNAAPANLVAGVTRDQLLALRGRAPDDSTTVGAVQVLPILITTQPQDATVSVGANASFTAAAVPGVGTSVAYQWQSSSDGGQNWADLAGQTSSSLVLASVPSGDDGLQVRVAVTDLRNQPVNSNPATLTVSANPTPSFPPGPPRDVVAVAGDGAVSVSWEPPASIGSFPVSSYQVEDESGRHTCLVSVASQQALECVIDGLVNGQEYAFRVRALNGAGWGAWSPWSSPVTPQPQPVDRSILITGSRDGRFVRVAGETTGLVGEQVIPRVRFPGPKPGFDGKARPVVDEEGEFTWQRRTNKKTYVFFFVEDVRSNRVVIKSRAATGR